MPRAPDDTRQRRGALLARVAAAEAEAARAYATGMQLRAQMMAEWHDSSGEIHHPEGHEITELAGTVRIGQQRAASQLSNAQRLVLLWRRSFAALQAGLMYPATAELLLMLTRNCSEAVQIEVERRVFAQLLTLNARDVRRLVLATVVEVEADLEPEATEQREQAAHAGRRVWTAQLPDQMAEIGAQLDTLAAKRWQLDFAELVRAQRHLDTLDGVTRTAAQREADVFAELPSRLVALIRALHGGDLDALLAVAALTPEQAAELRALTAEQPTDQPAGQDTDQPAGEPAGELGWLPVEEPAPAEEAPSLVPDDAALACDSRLEAALLGAFADSELDPVLLHRQLYGRPAPAPEQGWLDPAPDWDGWLASLTEPPPEPPEPPQPPQPPEPVPVPEPEPGLSWQELAVSTLRLRPAAPVSVLVHVPLSTALELDQRAGRVDGTGPGGAALPARRCRLLLPAAALTRLVTNQHGIPLQLEPRGAPPGQPRTAAQTRNDILAMISAAIVVEEAQAPHDPSRRLRTLVQLRDQHCTGIGCSTPARRCDLDHNTPWPDGPTAPWNLTAKSDRCHHLKHDGWTTDHNPDTGTTIWTSPTGHRYHSQAAWPHPTDGAQLAQLIDAYLAT
ncbi:MAG: HNH endonuclease signature motif containing protein [Mycobacteriales bacterium]